jgi:hypothetical protein
MCPESSKAKPPPFARSEDLRHLADYSFEGRNEADIKGDWIEPLLRLLGYGLGTRHDVFREKVLRLPEPVRMIGSKRIEIDFIPTVFGEQLWIMEAKRPDPGEDLFGMEHLGQAWSYATDPRIAVPLMVLCDGTRLGVFDVTRADWETRIFDHAKSDLPDRFDELFGLLGAPRIAERLRRDQLKHLRTALMAQVDHEPLEQTLRDVSAIVEEARPVVSRRRDEVRSEIRERVEKAGTPAIDAAGIWGLAGHLNGPLWSTLADIDHGVRLIRAKPPHLRTREFEDFEKACVMKAGEEPRMWFWLSLARMGCAVLLCDDEGCGETCRDASEIAARNHATAFRDEPLQAASYELQRALGPLGWRLAANAKPATDAAAQQVKDTLEAEEWLRLDSEFGVSATASYKQQALLGPRAILAQVDPWDVQTIQQTNQAARRLLDVLPKPSGMEELLPIGDPWQESWITGDPLRDTSAATLQALAARSESTSSSDFARKLYDTYFR